jgi:hypothetical protein
VQNGVTISATFPGASTPSPSYVLSVVYLPCPIIDVESILDSASNVYTRVAGTTVVPSAISNPVCIVTYRTTSVASITRVAVTLTGNAGQADLYVSEFSFLGLLDTSKDEAQLFPAAIAGAAPATVLCSPSIAYFAAACQGTNAAISGVPLTITMIDTQSGNFVGSSFVNAPQTVSFSGVLISICDLLYLR